MQIVRGLFFGVRMKNISKSRLAIYGFIGFALSMISFFLLDERVYHLTVATDETAREFWLIITDLGSSAWMVAVTLPLWLIGMGLARLKPANRDGFASPVKACMYLPLLQSRASSR